jgi:excisionase family DNA binding protein
MTMREAAEYMRVSYAHTRRLVCERDLPSIHIGSATRIDKAALDEWLVSKTRNRATGRSFAEEGHTTAAFTREPSGSCEAREGLDS